MGWAGRRLARIPFGGLIAAVVVAVGLTSDAGAASERGSVRLSLDAGGSEVTAKVAVAGRPFGHRITLNGHTITGRFDLSVPGGHPVGLGLDEGLRFGMNRLRVAVHYPSNRTVRRVARFKLDRRRPLVGAPQLGKAHSGAAVKLVPHTKPRAGSGAGRQAFSAQQGSVIFTWEIVDAPDASEAQIRNPGSRPARIVPDTPGIYKLRLTATRRGASASAAGQRSRSETIQLEAHPPETTRAGVFIGTESLYEAGDPVALRLFDEAGTVVEIGPNADSFARVGLLVIDRCTLQVLENTNFGADGTGSDTLTTLLDRYYPSYPKQNNGCNVMFVAAGADYASVSQEFSQSIEAAVGQSFLPTGETQPFWAVWIPNKPANSAGVVGSDNSWVNSPSVDKNSLPGRLTGVLAEDVSGRYSFRPSNFTAFGGANAQLSFHSDPSGISIPSLPTEAGYPGPTKIPAGSPPCAGAGGYQVLAMAAAGPTSLQELPVSFPYNGKTYHNGDTFWVNGCSEQESEDAAAAMLLLLEDLVPLGPGGTPADVFIQGVGNSMPANPSAAAKQSLLKVAYRIEELGGTPEAFVLNPTSTRGPGYALAGQNFIVPNQSRVATEVTSAAPGNPPAQLDGVLERDRHWRLAPGAGTPVGGTLAGGAGAGLALQAASAAVAQGPNFSTAPFPGQDDPERQKVMHYIAGPDVLSIAYDASTACYKPPTIANGFGDVRSAYCGGGSSCNEWSSQGRALTRLGYPAGQGFSNQAWTDVVDQLAGGGAGIGEFTMVDRVHCNVQNMQRVFGTAAGGSALLDVETFVTKINEFLQPPDDGAVLQIVFSVLDSLVNVAAGVSGVGGFAEAADVLWAVGASMEATNTFANLADGSPVDGPLPFNTTVETLAQQLLSGWQQASSALSVLDDQIVSDYVALKTFYESGANLQQQQVQNAETPLSLAAYADLWKWFIGKKYPPDHAWPNYYSVAPADGPLDTKTFYCYEGGLFGQDYYPYNFHSRVFGPDQSATQIEAPLYDNQNGYELYVMAGSKTIGDDQTLVGEPPAVLPGSLYGFPAATGSTPPPVDSSGTITPVGLFDQFLWHDLVYAATQTQRVFSFYDVRNPAPDVPYAQRQDCTYP